MEVKEAWEAAEAQKQLADKAEAYHRGHLAEETRVMPRMTFGLTLFIHGTRNRN